MLLLDCQRLSALTPERQQAVIEAAVSYCYLNRAIPALRHCNTPEAVQVLDAFRPLPLVAISGTTPLKVGFDEDFYTLQLTLPQYTLREQQVFWTAFAKQLSLPLEEDAADFRFADVFSLTPGQIKKALSIAEADSRTLDSAAVSRQSLTRAVRLLCRPRLAEITQPLNTSFQWEDLILGEEQERALRQLCDRMHNRRLVSEQWGFDKKLPYGKGISVLLYGPPEAPVEHMNLDFFAEHFELAGSNIKNIVVSAAYLAAAEGKQITREHIVIALKSEYLIMGRVLMEHELF